MRTTIAAIALLLTACGDSGPVTQQVHFLIDPASKMCMPIMTDGSDPDAPWAGWEPCADPCAGLDEADCKADPRCTPVYATPEPSVCPPNAACAPLPPPTYEGCKANPQPDPCLGLDEKTCTATAGCKPVYGGEGCACPVGPDGSVPKMCNCPAMDGYRGCVTATEPQLCTSDADCGAAGHCSVDDGDCKPPPGCGMDLACPAVCTGVCVPDGGGPGCFGVKDERTCIARADCEPVYTGSRCFCDAQGCGCLDYTFDSCRPRVIVDPPPPVCQPGTVVGSWASDAPPPRRVYTFNKDGSFSVEDDLGPCPPNAACVWSGKIINQGKWFPEAEPDASGSLPIGLAYQALQQVPPLVYPTTLKLSQCLLYEADTGRAFKPTP